MASHIVEIIQEETNEQMPEDVEDTACRKDKVNSLISPYTEKDIIRVESLTNPNYVQESKP